MTDFIKYTPSTEEPITNKYEKFHKDHPDGYAITPCIKFAKQKIGDHTTALLECDIVTPSDGYIRLDKIITEETANKLNEYFKEADEYFKQENKIGPKEQEVVDKIFLLLEEDSLKLYELDKLSKTLSEEKND